MRLLTNVALIPFGLLGLYFTYVSIFPNDQGLLDLSRLEMAFLVLFALAIRRVHSRNRTLGYGILITCRNVLISAGACLLTCVVGIGALMVLAVASGESLVPGDLSDDPAAQSRGQALWLGMLLIFTYIAAPRLPSPMPATEAALGESGLGAMKLNQIESKE